MFIGACLIEEFRRTFPKPAETGQECVASVTGARGFIGRAVVLRLMSDSMNVVGAVKRSTGGMGNPLTAFEFGGQTGALLSLQHPTFYIQ